MTAIVKAPRKKRYVERPDIRATLLDAAEALVREEGYAAATARRIASKVGLKHQVVFYYFGTQDDLLLALVRRTSDQHREALTTVLASKQPLRGLWDLLRDRHATKFHLELLALANHNEAIRSELAIHAVIVRDLEAEAIARHLKVRGIELRLSPRLVSILTNALARLLVQESTLGIDAGHDEVEALVEESLRTFGLNGEEALSPSPQP